MDRNRGRSNVTCTFISVSTSTKPNLSEYILYNSNIENEMVAVKAT